MIRVKLLAVLAGMIATVALSAVPAFAEFSSNSAATKGAVKTGAVVLEGGGATLECTSSSGTWTITNASGEAVTQGKNERLEFTTFTGCKAKSNILKGVTAVVKACTLELEQAPGEGKAKGSTVAACSVEVKAIGTCIITVEGGQKGLEKNLLTNVGENLEVTAADEGIKSKPNAACIGIKETSSAKQKAVAIAEGQKFV